MYSYVASYDYSQITAASDWPHLFCTLGVFVLHNFSQIIIDHWNKLPYEIVNTPSLFLFKTQLFK